MKLVYFSLLGVSLVLMGVFLYHNSSHPVEQLQTMLGKPVVIVQKLTKPNSTSTSTSTSFQTLMTRLADDNNGVIYLSSVDSAYLPMAINLYETSFKRLGISNYLFVCSDDPATEKLKERGINSVKYLGDTASDKVAVYGTKEFKRKTHLKTKIILDALLVGLTAVIVDVDIIFFTDPVPQMPCQDCDIQIQSDVVEGNSGFYMARPTSPALTLHKKAWDTALAKGETISNQKVVDRAMESMQKAGKIKVKTLDKEKFPSGYEYFEVKKRMFHWDNPPSREVICHNNWIVSMQAKRYRFKELLWWYVDDGYYSEPNRKYLAYENPQDFGDADTQRVETDTLMAAFIIADILNRTVILPTFTCHHCKYGACKVASKKCTFNTHYKIATFDSQLGVENYREHVFLDHPNVPGHFKTSSTKHLIHRPHGKHYLSSLPTDSTMVLTPENVEKGPTPTEIRNWFSQNTDPVLRFHSMYNILDALRTEAAFTKIKKAVNEHTDYRQY